MFDIPYFSTSLSLPESQSLLSTYPLITPWMHKLDLQLKHCNQKIYNFLSLHYLIQEKLDQCNFVFLIEILLLNIFQEFCFHKIFWMANETFFQTDDVQTKTLVKRTLFSSSSKGVLLFVNVGYLLIRNFL